MTNASQEEPRVLALGFEFFISIEVHAKQLRKWRYN